MGTPAEEGVLLSQLLATAKAGDEVRLERALAEFVVEQSDDGFMARWYVLASGALEVVDSLPGPSSGASALLAALARSMRCEDDLGEIVPIARLVHDFPHPDPRGRKSLPSRKQLPMMASALLTLAQDDELTVMVRLDPVTGLPVAMLDATTVDLRELDEATKLSVLAMKYVNAAGMNDSDALTDIAAQISQFRDGELHVMTNIVSWLHEAMKNRSEAAARWRVPPHL